MLIEMTACICRIYCNYSVKNVVCQVVLVHLLSCMTRKYHVVFKGMRCFMLLSSHCKAPPLCSVLTLLVT